MFSTLLFLSSAAAAHLQATPGGRLVVEPGSFGPEVEIELQQRCGDAVVLQSKLGVRACGARCNRQPVRGRAKAVQC